MTKPGVFVTRLIAQEALDKVAQDTDMEIWSEVTLASSDLYPKN